eukprot:TRINITY_DN14237_c0_g1_i1.p1 TRINITY_DN14237_c0_g1~~TRINITY_DN14237_c0_g1_i1.p1  ORF type:complete len:217 (+),score=47.67 TRINITY_DN14237_c0_g1_i1:79-729(+)
MLSRVRPAATRFVTELSASTRQPLAAQTAPLIQVQPLRLPASVPSRQFSSEAEAEAPSIDELRAKIHEANEQLAEFKEKLKASKADLQQATKRHQTDLENETKYGFTKLAFNLLHIPDNLERAIDSVKTDELDESKELRSEVEGVKQIRHSVELAFEKFGIHKMKALDDTFNPEKHEAMFAMEMPGKEASLIFHVMEPGYMIHDRTLRAAKVGITK